MNQQTVEQKIKDLKWLINDARENGFHNIADMWATELESVVAMAKMDGKLK